MLSFHSWECYELEALSIFLTLFLIVFSLDTPLALEMYFCLHSWSLVFCRFIWWKNKYTFYYYIIFPINIYISQWCWWNRQINNLYLLDIYDPIALHTYRPMLTTWKMKEDNAPTTITHIIVEKNTFSSSGTITAPPWPTKRTNNS